MIESYPRGRITTAGRPCLGEFSDHRKKTLQIARIDDEAGFFALRETRRIRRGNAKMTRLQL
jgi:hypothetical protein